MTKKSLRKKQRRKRKQKAEPDPAKVDYIETPIKC